MSLETFTKTALDLFWYLCWIMNYYGFLDIWYENTESQFLSLRIFLFLANQYEILENPCLHRQEQMLPLCIILHVFRSMGVTLRHVWHMVLLQLSWVQSLRLTASLLFALGIGLEWPPGTSSNSPFHGYCTFFEI